MFDALGIAEVRDQATQQTPERRLVTAGHAVTAMGLNGLGFVTQPLDLVPHFFQNQPTSRFIAPAIPAGLAGYTGHARAERGVRFLPAPQVWASSLALKKPERILALRMVMLVCFLV
jgi:transposase